MGIRYKLNGPPGSGKTETLMKILDKAMDEYNIKPKEIAFMSFTRTAANEARDRAQERRPEYKRNDFEFFGTIHSICKKIISVKKESLFIGKHIDEFIKKTGYRISGATQTDEEMFNQTNNVTIHDVFLNIRSLLVTTEEDFDKIAERFTNRFIFSEEEYKEFIEDYEFFKVAHNPQLFDFNDLLLEAIDSSGTLNSKILIIDEAQDLAKIHWKIIDKWDKNSIITIIGGDPYQAIYEFQGANPSLMINWPCDKEITLDKTFRCPKKIYNLSKQIIDKFEERYNDTYETKEEEGEIIEDEFELQNVKLTDDLFILTRTNRKMYNWINKCKEEGIPFSYISEKRKNIMDTKEAKIFRIIKDLEVGCKLSIKEICDLQEYIPTEGYLERGIKTRNKKLGITEGTEHINRNDKEWGIKHLDQFGFLPNTIEIIKQGKTTEILKDYNKENLKFYEEVYERFSIEPFGKKPPIAIGTIHSAKGKQADTVIIDSESTNLIEHNTIENKQPEHRLAYVAITRSKNKIKIINTEKLRYDYPMEIKKEIENNYKSTLNREELINEITKNLEEK